MAIILGSNFQLAAALPLDTRQQVADNTARDAIVSGVRWEGMIVYSIGAAACYQLVGGILNTNWTAIGSGGGSGSGFIATGPFTVTNNSNSDLLGELTDHTINSEVDYVARIVRGTTRFSRVEFSIFYRNGAWEIVVADERYGSTQCGVTFTVNTSTAQINAAADNGGSNATINLQKINWPV